MCMSNCRHLCMCTKCMPAVHKQEMCSRVSGTEVNDDCELPCECWG